MTSRIDPAWEDAELLPFLRRVFGGRLGYPLDHDFTVQVRRAETLINTIREYDDSDLTIERLRMALVDPAVLLDREVTDLQTLAQDVELCIIIFVRHAITHGPYRLESLGDQRNEILAERMREMVQNNETFPGIRQVPSRASARPRMNPRALTWTTPPKSVRSGLGSNMPSNNGPKSLYQGTAPFPTGYYPQFPTTFAYTQGYSFPPRLMLPHGSMTSPTYTQLTCYSPYTNHPQSPSSVAFPGVALQHQFSNTLQQGNWHPDMQGMTGFGPQNTWVGFWDAPQAVQMRGGHVARRRADQGRRGSARLRGDALDFVPGAHSHANSDD